jgi:hypothetical protein
MSTRFAYTSAAFLLVLALAPTPSLAQQLSFLDKIFGNVTDLDAEYLFGTPIGNTGIVNGSSGGGALGRLRGEGIEATIRLGAIATRNGCGKEGESLKLKEIRVHKATPGRPDTIEVYTVTTKKPSPKCELLEAELGFGYSQLSGFHGDSGLQGSVEELPALSFYVEAYPRSWVSPYAGIRGGLTKLKDFRASVSDSLLQGAGSTFEYGMAAGLSFGKPQGSWAFFVEGAWTWRKFEGVTWSGSKVVVPPILQAPLRLHARTLSVGGQIYVGSEAKETP